MARNNKTGLFGSKRGNKGNQGSGMRTYTRPDTAPFQNTRSHFQEPPRNTPRECPRAPGKY